ncbi:hypothetical protein CF326_g5734 [Tilletia indica]|nr:hypothetical protein CF326_g5734 [Tilletia indica]
MQDLRHVFKVRRKKVKDFLTFLSDNNKSYPELEIDEAAIQLLPDDDVPELLMRYVVHHETGDAPSLFDKETSGIENHPSSVMDTIGDGSARTFLERHGMVDINGARVPAHTRMANALLNTVQDSASTGNNLPDLVVRHGSTFIKEYGNPDLFPGMYPSLFPWGIGGFEEARTTPFSLDRQAKYLLDLADASFRRHWSFIFVVANLKQRRAIHNQSRIACKQSDFPRISRELRGLDVDMIKNIHDHIAQGGSTQTLTAAERRIYTLIKKCELLSVHVPGSKGAMNRARAEIRGYTGQFGIFHLFLTLTPSTANCPVFQIFYGDTGVHLDVRSPNLPSTSERSVRVADDPVAAADFFHFHVHAVFKYLFGWDFKKKQSSSNGGILGELAAFYLVREHTMRGQLHGHALIWLRGGINPDVLRRKLQDDSTFQARYLEFFDDLIVHHAPKEGEGVSLENVSSRIQRPPDPDQDDYSKTFQGDHSRLAEAVQRHKCGFTCFKGGRDSCRFLFPHVPQAAPMFDAETNSILPRILDPTMNWHNPTLLVATRHNQDLKSVQSGKSSAAAASYITSYATKSDETPANQISMINTVFQRMNNEGLGFEDVKALLVRCVMQFGRERQLHAQQAATYVRDLGDTLSSHVTVPMLSGALHYHVLKMYGPLRVIDSVVEETLPSTADAAAAIGLPSEDAPTANNGVIGNDNDGDDSDSGIDDDGDEQDLMPLSSTKKVRQLDDYLHRGETLDRLNFYDFVKYCKLVPIPKRSTHNYHTVSETHADSGESCHRYIAGQPIGIPRAVYSAFPRPDGTPLHGDAYCAMMLAHFRPFSVREPLMESGQTYEDVFAATNFSETAKATMANWRAVSECEDSRDADMLRRRKQEASREAKSTEAICMLESGEGMDDSAADINVRPFDSRTVRERAELSAFAAPLSQHGWFQSKASDVTDSASIPGNGIAPRFTISNVGRWKKDRVVTEETVRADQAAPRAQSGVLAEDLGLSTQPASTVDGTSETFVPSCPIPALETQRMSWNGKHPAEIVKALILERNLTPSQQLAFTIVARHFFEQMHDNKAAPLRLLMHGEAGTGKTVVVRLLRELLERFGKGSEILLMAPTGKAAAAIGGSTQHSTFSLKIRKKKATTDELRNEADTITPARIRKLQERLGGIKWLFFDEVSMTSCEVLSEMDQALRIATSRPDEAFGGLNVLFAGDFCQLPPVGSTPLYSKTSSKAGSPDIRCKVELGKAAWLAVDEVVEFVEQMRMQDKEMAALLSRMRVRSCIDADATLLNKNVMRVGPNTAQNSSQTNGDAIVLAQTNEAVRVFNHQKATSQALRRGDDVRISCAVDTTDSSMSLSQRNALLQFNGNSQARIGLGKIPLYYGMPVVFRGGNLSVPLGATNGAFATLAGWDLVVDQWGLEIPRGAVLQFDGDASWKLDDFERGCLPVTPTASSFKYQTAPNPKQTVSRKQLPFQPGFAMTIHSAQGITSKTGIITDLRNGGFETYVAASRATKRSDVHLVAPVTKTDLNMPPLPRALRQELLRLESLATATKARYEGQDWSGVRAENGAKSRPRENDDHDNNGNKRPRL